MTVKLTDPLPLRTSAVWSRYDEIVTLPRVYGQVTLSPVRYKKEQNVWLLADHPIAGVDVVERSGQAYSAWILRQEADETGHPVALLETQNSTDAADEWQVTLRGLPHPDTGALMSRPDLILWDLLANLAGRDLAYADLDDLRVLSQTQGLRIGGILDDHRVTIQGWIDRICQAAGLAWASDMPSLATQWPREPGAVIAPEITAQRAPGLTAEADIEGLSTIVQLDYDYDWANGDYRHSATLRATSAIERYGEIEGRLQLGWIHGSKIALAQAERWLQYHARPLWTIKAPVPSGNYPPGASVTIDHPYSPVSAGIVIGRERGETVDRITIEAPAPMDAPAVALVNTGGSV